DANRRMFNNSLSSNFSNGTHCLPVNGWFCCLDRQGEFLWHGHDRFVNQLIVAEQFKALPVLLFSSRYLEPMADGRPRLVARTGSLSKVDGKAIWWSPEIAGSGVDVQQVPPAQVINNTLVANSIAQFHAYNIDQKAGTINLVGMQNNRIVVQQHYV